MVPDTPPSASPQWHTLDAASGSGRPATSPVPAVVLAMSGILLTTVVGLTLGAPAGSFTLAATLAVAGAWRAVSPTGPAGLAIRSRGFDVLLCWGAAMALTVLALTAPGI